MVRQNEICFKFSQAEENLITNGKEELCREVWQSTYHNNHANKVNVVNNGTSKHAF